MPRHYRHEIVPSTNEQALEAIAAGTARDGDVHLARGQTAGRGRRGSTWQSPPGEGLYASVVLLPPPPAPEPPGLTIAAGLAAFDVARSLGLAAARLKWPNDLLVGDAKLAGILVEARGWSPERPAFVVGLGLNVRQRTFHPDLAAERAVTSLALEGLATTPEEVLDAWLPAFARRREELGERPPALLADYLAATGLRDREIRIRMRSGWHEGRLVGLDLERGLALRTGTGTRDFPLAHVLAVEAL